ncbi:MAG: lycopene beta-cyclase [Mariniblastus sp.]|jgi:lycopene beta-cyclase
MTNQNSKYDYILVGGGLQAGLLALAIDHHKPQSRVLLIEKNDWLFGNHTWSCHETDIPETVGWLEPIAYRQWPAYTVKFPKFEQRINMAYRSFSSDQLASAVQQIASRGKLEIRTRTSVAKVGNKLLTTDNGETLEAVTVIDCRGDRRDQLSNCGFQKFHGFEVKLDRDWPDPLPVLMDATMDQQNGFRFLYVLPLSKRRVLIEDTYFSDSSTLDRQDSLSLIQDYLAERSITQWSISREERGCLPMPFDASMKPSASSPLRGGFCGGWFHAATGYSLPLAVRFADTIATSPAGQVDQQILRLAKQNMFQAGFSRFLNRLLFQLVSPRNRFQVFRRFYRALPDETIKRFFAHQFTKSDAARILIGSPPRGLTPFRFLNSFKANSCPTTPH